MPRFEITQYRAVEQHRTFTVEADNRHAAEDAAFDDIETPWQVGKSRGDPRIHVRQIPEGVSRPKS